MHKIDLPDWCFDVAYFIARERHGKFRNRFYNKRLRDRHKELAYFRHSEGIMGYLGDIGAALLLGVDPYQMFCDMIDATDGLAHRDQSDMNFRQFNVDAKVEDFGGYHAQVINGEQGPTAPYGCRLINLDQYEDNKASTDIYLFGCFDPPLSDELLIHDIRSVLWLGWVDTNFVEGCFGGGFVPGGNRLPAWAKQIPHGDLRPVSELLTLNGGSRPQPVLSSQKDWDEATVERAASLKAKLAALMS